MSKQPKEYLEHILDELNYLISSSKNITSAQFAHDPTLQRAYSRSIEIIGEAAKNLPSEFTQEHSQVNWKSIAGMRDKLIHHYFGVDYDIVWDVVKNEAPQLKPTIKKLLRSL